MFTFCVFCIDREIDMHLKSIECFTLIADLKSISKAAKMLFLSPPAVTQQLNALEELLQFKLFNRSNKGVTLTEAGKAFYDDARKIVSISNTAVAKSRAIAEKKSNSISVGVSGPVCASLLPAIIRDFRESYPEVTVKFVDDLTNTHEQVLQGTNDVNITYGNRGIAAEGIQNTLLCMDDPVCLISLNHPFALRKSLCIRDFIGLNFVLTAPGISEYHDDLYARMKNDYPQINTQFVDRHDSGLMQMDADNAVALVPRLFELEDERFITLPFEGLPKISINLFTRDGTIHNFVESAKSTIKRLHGNIGGNKAVHQ